MRIASGSTRLVVEVRGRLVAVRVEQAPRQALPWEWDVRDGERTKDGSCQTYADAYRAAMRAAEAMVPRGARRNRHSSVDLR